MAVTTAPPPTPTDGLVGVSSRRPGLVRLWVRWTALLSLPALLAASCSLMTAATDSNNLALSERAVEWLRGHRFGDLVSSVEAWWYSNHQPPLGGTIAALPSSAPASPTVPTSSTPGGAPGPSATASVDAIAPFTASTVPGEGVWSPIGDPVGGAVALQVAYLRPDAVHGGVLAGVLRIDQRATVVRLVPGSQEPGGVAWARSTQLTAPETSSVLAAFNSGFRLADSRGGAHVAGRTVGTLRDGAASLVIRNDGRADVVQWGRAAAADASITAVRQNLDLIVDGGQVVDGLDDNTGNRWGKTVGNRLYVWRSGAGIDSEGRLLYAASGGLSVASLASLLARAGAVRAMELDINHAWVSCNVFTHDGSATNARKLLPEMKKPAERYLSPDARDFLAVLPRSGGAA